MTFSNEVFGKGSPDPKDFLTESDIKKILTDFFSANNLSGKKVLVIIPDSTRTMPLPLFFKLFYELIHDEVKTLDFMIALGTHPPMSDEAIADEIGISIEEMKGKYQDISFFNHHWDDPKTFIELGEFPKNEVIELTKGTVQRAIPIQINKIILNYDALIVLGPVFPHEVMGFSGGSKYFFPGISGPDLTNTTHWIGALHTCIKTIGLKITPQRQLIERAANLIPVPKLYCCPVVKKEGIFGFYAGEPYRTWEKAVDLSSQVHVKYVDKPFKKVISVMPHLYDDIWTAGKGMYKLEPVVEDGGELIIYAPHITEISYTHGKTLDRIGYHCLDYFLKQWEKFKDEPWGILAHSTHVTGLGTYENGIEKKRIKVSLATGIPKERCERVDLGYVNPQELNLQEYEHKEHEGILLVPYAGETLYRLKQ